MCQDKNSNHTHMVWNCPVIQISVLFFVFHLKKMCLSIWLWMFVKLNFLHMINKNKVKKKWIELLWLKIVNQNRLNCHLLIWTLWQLHWSRVTDHPSVRMCVSAPASISMHAISDPRQPLRWSERMWRLLVHGLMCVREELSGAMRWEGVKGKPSAEK